MHDFLKRLDENKFIDDLRIHLLFNDDEYQKLLDILNELKIFMQGKQYINKRLAAYLLEILKMTMIWHDKLINYGRDKNSDIILKLENAWYELDAIILEEILWAD